MASFKDIVSSRRTPLLLLSLATISLLLIEALRDSSHHHHAHSHAPPSYSDIGPMGFPSKIPDQIILNLTEDPLHSVAVNWRTDASIDFGEVQVSEALHNATFQDKARIIPAKSEHFVNQFQDEPKVEAYYHSAIIDDLRRGVQYVYRVGADSLWSEWFQIKMPDPKRKSLSFIYFGDAQNDVKSHWSRVIREAFRKMPNVDFMLHAGDLINYANRDLEWAEWFHAGGFIHAMVPSIMTPGNHEYYRGRLSAHWKPQFNLPANGPTNLAETCYQINYPQVKLVSLNAEMIGRMDAKGITQVRWLDSILTHDPRKWTALTLHYPLFSTSEERDNPELRAILKPTIDRHGVDIVLQGHDHAYGRGFMRNEPSGVKTRDPISGTMYVVSVSGPKMYEISEKMWMQRKGGSTQLFQIITIDGNTLSYEAFAADGSLYDAFDIVKKSKQGNVVYDRAPATPERINRQATK